MPLNNYHGTQARVCLRVIEEGMISRRGIFLLFYVHMYMHVYGTKDEGLISFCLQVIRCTQIAAAKCVEITTAIKNALAGSQDQTM